MTTQRIKQQDVRIARNKYIGMEVRKPFESEWYHGIVVNIDEIDHSYIGALVLFEDQDSADYTLDQIDMHIVRHHGTTNYWCIHCKGYGPVDQKTRDLHYEKYHSSKISNVKTDHSGKLIGNLTYVKHHPKYTHESINTVINNMKTLRQSWKTWPN